jgi:hypothetical protein
MPAEMEFVRRMAKYRWQDYKTNEDILSEFKISPVVKTVQNYRHEWVQRVWIMEGDKTATLSYEMSTVWETKPKTTPQNTSSGTGTQLYQATWKCRQWYVRTD